MVGNVTRTGEIKFVQTFSPKTQKRPLRQAYMNTGDA
jgi:hypothetical protein